MAHDASRRQPNAADPLRIRRSERKARERRGAELRDVRAILETEYGRRFLMRLLAEFGVLASIWDPSSKIHLNAGKQWAGLFLLEEIDAADEEAFHTMRREARARVRAEQQADGDTGRAETDDDLMT